MLFVEHLRCEPFASGSLGHSWARQHLQIFSKVLGVCIKVNHHIECTDTADHKLSLWLVKKEDA